MQRIEGQGTDSQQLARNVISWIVCAKRPLTTLELQHALAVVIGETELDHENFTPINEMVSVCAGLVTVDERSGIIRLVHYTTQEYFHKAQEHRFPNAETDITKVCVSYLSLDAFESGPCHWFKELEGRLDQNALYDYSAKNWGHHARKATILCPEVIRFLNCKMKLEASTQALLRPFSWPKTKYLTRQMKHRMTGLHLAAYFGVEEAVNTLLSEEVATTSDDQALPGARLDLKDSFGRTPLSWAAQNGHEAVVKQLLEKGTDIDLKDGFGCTPLSLAADNGQEAVVKQLLEKGADLDSKNQFNRTPLLLAARNGYEAVVKHLLDKCADIDTKDKYNHTPLSWAAQNGHEAVVKQLLDKGADIDTKDQINQMPLLWAARNGHEAVVKQLLDKGADIDTKNRLNETPLSRAAENGHEAVVKQLLDKGADIDTKDLFNRTPLSWASENGHDAVVKQLLEKGADLGLGEQATVCLGRRGAFRSPGWCDSQDHVIEYFCIPTVL
jgi:ankyrin repeat protein